MVEPLWSLAGLVEGLTPAPPPPPQLTIAIEKAATAASCTVPDDEGCLTSVCRIIAEEMARAR